MNLNGILKLIRIQLTTTFSNKLRLNKNFTKPIIGSGRVGSGSELTGPGRVGPGSELTSFGSGWVS